MTRSRHFWFVGVSLLTAVAALAEEPFRPRKYQPADWVAFVSNQGAFFNPIVGVREATPDVIIYRDGRMVWRREVRGNAFNNREQWREAKLPQQALDELLRLGERNRFFQLRPEPPQVKRQLISDLPVTTVGIALPGGRRRVVDAYALDFYGSMPTADALTRSTAEVANAIFRTRPTESWVHTPPVARVGFYRFQGSDQEKFGKPAAWPLVRKPTLMSTSWGPFEFCEGNEVAMVAEALEGTMVARLDGEAYWASWAPAISIPEPTVAVGPIPRPIEEPEALIAAGPSGNSLPALLRTLKGHLDYVGALAWSPDSTRLVSGTQLAEDDPRIWDVRTGKLLHRLPGCNVYRLAWTPDGKRVAVGAGHQLFFWRKGTEYERTVEHNGWWTDAIAFSPDGTKVAFGGALQVAERENGKTLWSRKSGRRWARDVAWRPDGKLIATSDRAGALQLFDARTGNEVRTLGRVAEPGERHYLHRPIAWEPGGKLVAVPDERASVIRIWNSATGETRHTLPYEGAALNALSWSGDRRYLAATGGSTLQVYNLRTGLHRSFSGTMGLYSGAWSPDSRRFAAGTSDRTVLIWDAVTLRKGL
jgi:Tol biopolymer transport system component